MTIHSGTPPTDNDDDNAMQLASVPTRENFPLHHCSGVNSISHIRSYLEHYCDVSPFDLYISSGFANQLSCLVIFSLPFFGNHNLLFNRVNVLLTYTITGFKSAE